ncbi:Transglutaminase-like protein [Neocallimastix lanati (nom. inval.)]|uniref:Transglutaminase-like protein n=1 Tax=Neocallimastix californiae TaxID=1754190 RepID=A0A1Y2BPV8_9FUNG|nr:Transglutaminase-like protein [Neocallimastix sp. JGI-2020a]ORY36779.1 Transglutaminase-like protein [Neocallimastix californiae]|eukprot:ORY36779.1 Transglutaminase-like protein [Neocallimastix californiae]
MFEKYLSESKYINYNDKNIQELAKKLKEESKDEIDLIKNTFNFVLEKIHHSWDVKDKRVTVSASDCLREGVGICWAKSNLLSALYRANGIPSGISYQRLTLGDTPDTGYCIHSLNTVYISSLDKWIRLDPRGNNENIHAKFSLDKEILAFTVNSEGEKDYFDNNEEPDKGLMKVLENNTDALYMYSHCLPDKLSWE